MILKEHISATLQLLIYNNLLTVPMDIVSLSKILCHRNFGNEFVFTHSKGYLYYFACSSLSQTFDNETLPEN